MDDTAPELRVLLVEDNAQDAELIQRALAKAGIFCKTQRVETRPALALALAQFAPDVVLADYSLPQFDGRDVVRLVREQFPQVPVIMVTGTLGDEGATELLKMGARDFVLKDRLARLGPAVRRAISEERGIRARKAAENAVRESEMRFRALIEYASDIVGVVAADGTLKYASPALRAMGGYEPAEVIGLNYLEFMHPEDIQKSLAALKTIAQAPGTTVRTESRFRHKDGTWRAVESLSRNLLGVPSINGIVVNLRDVTERKAMEDRLRLANVVVEASPSVLFRWAPTAGWPVTYVSENLRQWGYAPDEFLSGKRLYAAIIHPEDLGTVEANCDAALAKRAERVAFEYRILTAGGEVRWVDERTSVTYDAAGVASTFQGIVLDVTDRRRADEEIRRSRASLAEAQSIAHLGSWELDVATGRMAWSEETYRIMGVAPARFTPTYDSVMARVHPEDRERAAEAVRIALERGGRLALDHRVVLDDGSIRHVQELAVAHPQPNGRPARLVGTILDITERKRAQEALAQTLSRVENHLAAVGVASEVEARSAGDVVMLAQEVTRLAAEVVGVERATVWLFNADESELHCIDSYVRSTGEHGAGEALLATGFRRNMEALKTGRFVDATDALSDPRTRGYADGYLKLHGIVSMLDAPIRVGGRNFGLLCVEQVGARRRWEQDEIAFVCQLADKLGFALTTRKRRQMEDQLRETMEATVHAVASTVERRDLYTAGHQRRVAVLVSAIAREMGLDDERINGLRLAAIIHDVGKIVVPSEILSKPGRLTALEFELVKQHPGAGYEILKDVSFPWPIAEIVRQHHERLDGSGYPRGLKGDEILPEARILSVADVVEAIASHRPYRPSHGLDTALKVIEAGRGTQFDTGAVDACLRLFREQGYGMPV